MECEVCFKEIESGRRCKKHPEYHPEAIHLKALKEDPAYRLECRLIDMEGQITPSLCQDLPEDNFNPPYPKPVVKYHRHVHVHYHEKSIANDSY